MCLICRIWICVFSPDEPNIYRPHLEWLILLAFYWKKQRQFQTHNLWLASLRSTLTTQNLRRWEAPLVEAFLSRHCLLVSSATSPPLCPPPLLAPPVAFAAPPTPGTPQWALNTWQSLAPLAYLRHQALSTSSSRLLRDRCRFWSVTPPSWPRAPSSMKHGRRAMDKDENDGERGGHNDQAVAMANGRTG